MSRFFFTLLSLATIGASTSLAGRAVAEQTPAEQTVEEFVAAVLQGPGAAVIEAELVGPRGRLAGAGRWPNPALSWERQAATSGAREGEREDAFVATLPIVLSGRLGLEREAARLGVGAAEARAGRARAELILRARSGFYAALTASQKREVLGVARASVTGLAAMLAAREQAGEAAGYDRLRVELEAAAVAGLLSDAALEELRATSAAAVLVRPGGALRPVGALAPEGAGPDPAALESSLQERRTDLCALSLEAAAGERAAEAAGRSAIPELALTGGARLLDAGSPGSGAGYVAGVGVELPLFDRAQGARADAEGRSSAARARHAELAHAAAIELRAAIEVARARRERLAQHRTEVLARAEELERIATAAYGVGGAELLVLVDAARALREARLSELELALAARTAEDELRFFAGEWDGTVPGGSR